MLRQYFPENCRVTMLSLTGEEPNWPGRTAYWFGPCVLFASSVTPMQKPKWTFWPTHYLFSFPCLSLLIYLIGWQENDILHVRWLPTVKGWNKVRCCCYGMIVCWCFIQSFNLYNNMKQLRQQEDEDLYMSARPKTRTPPTTTSSHPRVPPLF